MSSTKHYVTVVGIDFSDLSNHALDQALEVTALRKGEVHVVFVEPEMALDALLTSSLKDAVSADAAVEQVRQRALERVNATMERVGGLSLHKVVAHFRKGSPAQQIAQLAADLDADLVVVGSHGRHGVQRLLLGSVADRVTRLARCPVWIVRPKDHVGAVRVPDIEPPCPDCLAKRAETNGKEMWCARHAEHHTWGHRVTYVSDSLVDPSTIPYESTPEG